MKVNNASAIDFRIELEKASALYTERNKYNWDQDVSWLNMESYNDSPSTGLSHKDFRILDLPENYVLIDVETTGLNSFSDKIIEVAALRVRNNEVVDVFSSIVNPDKRNKNHVSDRIFELTGITNEMVNNSSSPKFVFPKFSNFIGNDILVGYNTLFDYEFISEAFSRYLKIQLTNKFVDVRNFVHQLIFNLRDEKLNTIANFFEIKHGFHRAETDCFCTKSVYDKLKDIAISKYGNLDSFLDMLNSKKGKRSVRLLTESNGLKEKYMFFVGKKFYMFGRPELLDKFDIYERIHYLGGIIVDQPSESINYYIVSFSTNENTIRSAFLKYKHAIFVSEYQIYELFKHQDLLALNNISYLQSIFDIFSFMTNDDIENTIKKHEFSFDSWDNFELNKNDIENNNNQELLQEIKKEILNKKNCYICNIDLNNSEKFIYEKVNYNDLNSQAEFTGPILLCSDCLYMKNIHYCIIHYKYNIAHFTKILKNAIKKYADLNSCDLVDSLYAFKKCANEFLVENKPIRNVKITTNIQESELLTESSNLNELLKQLAYKISENEIRLSIKNDNSNKDKELNIDSQMFRKVIF